MGARASAKTSENAILTPDVPAYSSTDSGQSQETIQRVTDYNSTIGQIVPFKRNKASVITLKGKGRAVWHATFYPYLDTSNRIIFDDFHITSEASDKIRHYYTDDGKISRFQIGTQADLDAKSWGTANKQAAYVYKTYLKQNITKQDLDLQLEQRRAESNQETNQEPFGHGVQPDLFAQDPLAPESAYEQQPVQTEQSSESNYDTQALKSWYSSLSTEQKEQWYTSLGPEVREQWRTYFNSLEQGQSLVGQENSQVYTTQPSTTEEEQQIFSTQPSTTEEEQQTFSTQPSTTEEEQTFSTQPSTTEEEDLQTTTTQQSTEEEDLQSSKRRKKEQ
jgi:hypothetical protein